MSLAPIIKNDFLLTHLKYVHNTESPILMHVWSAIMAASAAMGRHVWIDSGARRLYANNYCLLVGPPGTRKNSAINVAVDLLRKNTQVKFAPDDTGGQRQGLIAAIENSTDNKMKTDFDDLVSDPKNFGVEDLAILGNINLNLKKDDPDKHAMFINATEFGSFLGQGSLDMTRFLIKMWDCEPYKYALKKEEMILKHPLVNLLGGTTSSDLSTLLPPEAIGQGFMSRIILVFAPRKHKSVPPSKWCLNTKHKDELDKVYRFLFHEMEGGMKKSQKAADLEDKIYGQNIRLQDTRFIHYSERRADHLAKLAMVLAAVRKSYTIEYSDYAEANNILLETEKHMTDALGEYGLSPLAVSRQKMIEFIQHAQGPVTSEILWLMLRKDMRLLDFKNSISELINAKKIMQIDTVNGKAFVFNDDSTGLLDLVAVDG